MAIGQASPNRGAPAQGVLICGMKRSGTTVLWETFRKDPRNLCFDEPFHPSLWQGKRQNGKGTWTELGPLFDRISSAFDKGPSAIRPIDELTRQSEPDQRRYLHDLMQQSERTVIDEVRLWNRMPEILPDDFPIVVVHLLRDPVNWVTAQMMPSVGKSNNTKRRFFARLGELGFFRLKYGYNAWSYEEIVEASLAADHSIFRFIPGAERRRARLPAFQKLIALWWAANRETRSRLSTWRSGPVVSVSLSEFSANPTKVIGKIYSAAGWDLPEGLIDFAHVRPVRPSWKPRSSNWKRAFLELGLPAALSEAHELDGDALSAVLDRHCSANALQSAGSYLLDKVV